MQVLDTTIKDLQAKVTQLILLMNFHTHSGADTTHQLPITTFIGSVASGATAGTPFPKGWTVSKSSSVYTIVHNLNNLHYVVVASIGSKGYLEVGTYTATSFQVSTFNSSDSATDSAFRFILQTT